MSVQSIKTYFLVNDFIWFIFSHFPYNQFIVSNNCVQAIRSSLSLLSVTQVKIEYEVFCRRIRYVSLAHNENMHLVVPHLSQKNL